MIYSTFSSLMTARSGIVASQYGLNVTGQNMANVNTKGYTRQRLDLVSVGSWSGTTKIGNVGVSVAGGVRSSGISQIRDQYLDARFRSEMADLGELSVDYSILNQLQDILDEVNMKGLTDAFSNLMAALEDLDNQKSGDYDVLVRTQAELLVSFLHTYSNQINQLRSTEEDQLQNIDVPRVNDILSEIEDISVAIRKAQAAGTPDLELEDQRNLLLDELSQYMDIKVTYTKDPGNPNCQLISIDLKGASGNLNILNQANKTKATFKAEADSTGYMHILINGADQTGEFNGGVFKGMLDMLNSRGEWDTPANAVRGIPYYEEMMKSLVNKFATEFNKANDDGNGIQFDLFDKIDPAGDFTMGNIKISDAWRDGTAYVITDNKVPNKLASLIHEKMDFYNTDTPPVLIYNGTLQEYVKYINVTLSSDVKATGDKYENKSTQVNNLDGSRLAISAVSMDEETVNLIMYQKSYNASSRMVTALDEALDQLINKTGIVGR